MKHNCKQLSPPYLAVQPDELAQRLLLLAVAARRLAAVLQLVPA